MNDWRDRLRTRLEELARSQGLTRETLAERLTTTPDTISQWLSGDRSPGTPEEYERIALALDMLPAELIFGICPKNMLSDEEIQIAEAYDGLSSNQRASVRRLYMRLRSRRAVVDRS
jgi:transcriptional regulator with XRE-family HTH domain